MRHIEKRCRECAARVHAVNVPRSSSGGCRECSVCVSVVRVCGDCGEVMGRCGSSQCESKFSSMIGDRCISCMRGLRYLHACGISPRPSEASRALSPTARSASESVISRVVEGVLRVAIEHVESVAERVVPPAVTRLGVERVAGRWRRVRRQPGKHRGVVGCESSARAHRRDTRTALLGDCSRLLGGCSDDGGEAPGQPRHGV